jgi:hypothetical protein
MATRRETTVVKRILGSGTFYVGGALANGLGQENIKKRDRREIIPLSK